MAASGNADVPVGSYVNADEDVGIPEKRAARYYERGRNSFLVSRDAQQSAWRYPHEFPSSAKRPTARRG